MTEVLVFLSQNLILHNHSEYMAFPFTCLWAGIHILHLYPSSMFILSDPSSSACPWVSVNLLVLGIDPVLCHCSLQSCATTSLHIKLVLTGKDPNSNPQALEEFTKFIQQKGFPPENIIVPEQRGE